MRVLHLEVQEFGALHGRRFSTDSDFVLVYGRNERGKSSFREALRSALFGFTARTPRLHPMAKRAFRSDEVSRGSSDEPFLELGATVRTAQGTFTIERRMDSGAMARLTLEQAAAADAAFVRANEPVPAVGSVTGSLFDAVYTLDPDSARAFDRHVEDEVRQLLLGGGALPDLPSVPELVTEVDAERARLWRDDRRSRKTVVAQLDGRLAALQQEGRESRRVEEELLRLESDLELGRQRLAENAGELTRARASAAILRLIEKAARIAREALDHGVDLSPFDDVTLTPPGPMLADLEDAELALEEPTRRLALEERCVDERSRALVLQRESIGGLARQEARVQQWISKAESQRLRAAELRRHGGVAAPRVAPSRDWTSAAAAGIVTGGIALGSGAHWAGAAAAALTPAVAMLLVAGRAGAVRAGRSGAPTDPENMPGTEADALDAEARELEQRAQAERERWTRMATDLAPEVPQRAWSTPEDAPDLLRDRLERALELERACRVDAEERRRAKSDEERAATRLRDVAGRFEELQAALEAAAPGEPILERAFGRVAEAWAARERSRGALRQLRADEHWSQAAGDPRLEAAIRDGEFDASELRRTETRIADLEAEMVTRRDELARMDERLLRERPKRTRSAIDSEALQLREERAGALARHGELTALREALVEGERRYRTEHQPAILESAGRWLEAITGGRYRALSFGAIEGEGEGERSGLMVMSREADRHVPCETPLSRGVREQVHLALRLGVAEAADAGGEPLPLLLDEALVHWDEERRAGLYRALRARAAVQGQEGHRRRARQVFLFTCHRALAEEAESQLGALRIDL